MNVTEAFKLVRCTLLVLLLAWPTLAPAAEQPGGPSRPSMASGGSSRPSMASGALGLLPVALGLLPGGPSRPSMASGALGLLPGDSIYRLPIALTDQEGKDFHLVDRRGTLQLVSMFYTSCPYVCPLIIDTIKKTQRALTDAERSRVHVLLVSFDPERDSVARLKEVYGERKIDAATWTLARTDAASVRKLAAVLGVQYRKLANREINHSTAIVLLDPEGRIVARTDKLGDVDADFVAVLRKAIAAAGG